MRVFCINLIITGLAFFFISCESSNPVSSSVEITSENVVGLWYNQYTNTEMNFSTIIYFDVTCDSASIGILNENDEVKLFCFEYNVKDGKLMFDPPEDDTVNQNALQLFFVSTMSGFLNSEYVYINNDDLCFDDDTNTTRFSHVKPVFPGGKISGDISVTGEFGLGMIMVAAVNPGTMDARMMLTDKSGFFSIQGLMNGNYWLVGLYIPKEHALDFWIYGLSQYPRNLQKTLIEISDSIIVTNKNIEIEIKNEEN